jgi:hypothetical protein
MEWMEGLQLAAVPDKLRACIRRRRVCRFGPVERANTTPRAGSFTFTAAIAVSWYSIVSLFWD